MATSEAQLRAVAKYNAEKTRRVDCRLPIDIAEAFNKAVEKNGRTKNSVIREFIEKYILENS